MKPPRRGIIIRLLVTSPFKSKYFQISCNNYCSKTIEATLMKKVPNESKLMHPIYILLKLPGVCCFHMIVILNTKTN